MQTEKDVQCFWSHTKNRKLTYCETVISYHTAFKTSARPPLIFIFPSPFNLDHSYQ